MYLEVRLGVYYENAVDFLWSCYSRNDKHQGLHLNFVQILNNSNERLSDLVQKSNQKLKAELTQM